jgi:hypothetical protein
MIAAAASNRTFRHPLAPVSHAASSPVEVVVPGAVAERARGRQTAREQYVGSLPCDRRLRLHVRFHQEIGIRGRPIERGEDGV